jgi:hypothetical protein
MDSRSQLTADLIAKVAEGDLPPKALPIIRQEIRL